MKASVVEGSKLILLGSLVPSIALGLCCEEAEITSIGVVVPTVPLTSCFEIKIFCKCSFNRIIAANSAKVMPTKKSDTNR